MIQPKIHYSQTVKSRLVNFQSADGWWEPARGFWCCGVVGLLGLLLSMGCATQKESQREPMPGEQVLIETLPRSAVLEIDGAPMGMGAHTLQVRDLEHRYQIKVSAPGYQTENISLEGAKLTGAQLGVALKPKGFGSARSLDFDDVPALAAATVALTKSGNIGDCVDYAHRAIEVDSTYAPAYRALGRCLVKAGKAKEAGDALSRYLSLAPEAQDASQVQTELEKLRGDMTIQGSGRTGEE